MKFGQILGIVSLGMFAFFGCEGDNSITVDIIEKDISLADRVGPVSQYGQLQAGQVDGIGHIYGACKGISAGYSCSAEKRQRCGCAGRKTGFI